MGVNLKKGLAVLVTVCLMTVLTGCSDYSGATIQAKDNCSSLFNDPYFTYLPSADKDADPRGYFDQVVESQEQFLIKIASLIPSDDKEQQLLGTVFNANTALLDFYVGQQLKRNPGQTALEFQQSMTDAEFGLWLDEGLKAKAATTQSNKALLAYGDHCNAGTTN